MLSRSLSAENHVSIFGKRGKKDHSKHCAGNDLSDTHGQHHKGNGKIDPVSVMQHKGDDEGVCNDRWNRCQKAVAAELVGEDRAQQCGNASEQNVNGDRTAQEVGDDTAHK